MSFLFVNLNKVAIYLEPTFKAQTMFNDRSALIFAYHIGSKSECHSGTMPYPFCFSEYHIHLGSHEKHILKIEI